MPLTPLSPGSAGKGCSCVPVQWHWPLCSQMIHQQPNPGVHYEYVIMGNNAISPQVPPHRRPGKTSCFAANHSRSFPFKALSLFVLYICPRLLLHTARIHGHIFQSQWALVSEDASAFAWTFSASVSFTWFKNEVNRASLVVQWIRLRLPLQTGDMGSIPDPGRSHMSWSSGAHCYKAQEPQREALSIRSPHSATGEEPAQQQRPSAAKNKINSRFFLTEKKKQSEHSQPAFQFNILNCLMY